jgi:hypothetical protein
MPVLHIPQERLEKYVLDHIVNETELAEIEEHLLWCGYCLDYVEDMERFLKALKAGTKLGGFDVEIAAEVGVLTSARVRRQPVTRVTAQCRHRLQSLLLNAGPTPGYPFEFSSTR